MYLPASQASQCDAPRASEKVPALHSTHSAALAAACILLYLPVTHSRQEEKSTAAGTGLYRPGPHAVQFAGPTFVLNFPALHSVHSMPSSPKYPGLHLQSTISSLSDGESDPNGQTMHAVDAAESLLYVPEGQEMQRDVPLTALWVPARHSRHGPPSRPL